MSAINLSSPSSLTDSPWNRSWPANELETVSACPVCGSTERTVLFDGLKDNVFFVALGKWILHSCTQCNSAYLDPRPSRASIGKAYGSYYTHAVGTGRENDKKLAFFKRLRRMMSNGYLNHRFGTNRFPASGLGQWVAKLLPSQREILDTEFRYLPKPTQGQRLLDIGCGNGFFLASAKEAGWQVSGVEPDPVAAAVARDRGVHVMVGTVDLLADESNCFDVITLSHVIEHVHEPQKLLESVHRLLKPGGVIYVETPNIESHGAALFKKEWRGLESPRHPHISGQRLPSTTSVRSIFPRVAWLYGHAFSCVSFTSTSASAVLSAGMVTCICTAIPYPPPSRGPTDVVQVTTVPLASFLC